MTAMVATGGPGRVQKRASSGTTRKIREQLNFCDERLWKRFSGRRLELIDKFKLSERKASEQDKNIRQIATILRTEFGYPSSSSPEFEKLVTAAVQSVRRNRKRSSKSRFLSTEFAGAAAMAVAAAAAASSPSPAATFSHSEEETSSSHPASPLGPADVGSLQVTSEGVGVDVARQGWPLLQPKPDSGHVERATLAPPLPSTACGMHPQNCDELIKAMVADIVHNRVPLHDQSGRDADSPNLADFAMSSNDSALLSLALSRPMLNKPPAGAPVSPREEFKTKFSSDGSIPYFLREKLILHIQRSRACFEIGSSQGSLDLYTNLMILGEMSTKASVAFVMERFFSNLASSSMEYITTKLNSPEQLAEVSLKLFSPATQRHPGQMSRDAQLKLLYLLIGGIVKDFGFDPCIYPLGEAMYDVIVKHYPLMSQPTVESQRSAVMSSLSMAPAAANKDVNRQVVLKFKGKEQRFTFHLLSNGSPTITEILENSRNLFQIVSQAKNLYLLKESTLIKDDLELSKIFNSFTTEEIILEICEMKDEPFSGLTILSNVSASTSTGISPVVKPETSTSPISTPTSNSPIENQATFKTSGKVSPLLIRSSQNRDRLTISNKPGLPPLVRLEHQRGAFDNNNLPQPVFQPLL
ncbi:LAMI_0G11914g1_1 [Lachancea mirantina]|uniref:LAMI_0G11914g1_1 n=1 Tax=Lachancea mirantina TaxID=1230905 RepID=A0A1G4KB56_9SACH|nr:LAMI_0G11914g1_1 [Lachancea mirantina]